MSANPALPDPSVSVPSTLDPFHTGERALQTRLGVRERMAQIGPRVIRDHMPDQHRDFFAQLPLLFVGSVDAHGQPWASVIQGQAGFVHSPHAQLLRVDAPHALGQVGILSREIGAPLGLLGIEFHTRRRNRMNGRISAHDAHGFDVAVEHSFGNCPKYIHPRQALAPDASTPIPANQAPETLTTLDDEARALITRADTLFIASTKGKSEGKEEANRESVDISHRGGEPGFVQINAAGQLELPDYAGNFFFNTLGNLTLEPRAGMLFIDTDTGDLLHLAAHAQIAWDDEQLRTHLGAQRLVQLTITSAMRVRRGLTVRWC
jgi:uncharacterized protein